MPVYLLALQKVPGRGVVVGWLRSILVFRLSQSQMLKAFYTLLFSRGNSLSSLHVHINNVQTILLNRLWSYLFLGRGATFIWRFFYPRVCVTQNLVHEMATKIWWRYLSRKRHWYCTDCTIQWQCTQEQYWHLCWLCRWLHAGLYCIAPQPFTRFMFLCCQTEWEEN